MQKLMRRGRRVAVLGVLSGAMLTAMAISGPAGAETTPATNHVIVGSGSSTTYNMMQSLDTLFNDSLGCYMTQPSTVTQTLNFSCASAANNPGHLQVGQGYTENPVNDVATEEPALGSGAGIQQLEFGGTGNDGNPGVGGTADPTASINYARSSRQFKTSDYPGLNFVAYATDGVSWLTFPTIAGKATPSHGVANLTTTQLTAIWNGTDTNWDQVGGTAGRICVYVAQLSSGTESTWASALGFSSPATLNAFVDGFTAAPAGCHTPKGVSYAESHTIFENEGQDIVKNGDERNAIFFFSYGKYQVVCAKTRTSQCDDNLKPATNSLRLGRINGITATPTTILCDTAACKTPFPVTRDLFNVYSNGSFKNAQFGFPAATPATINYVSEIGFLCKTQLNTKGVHVDDPSTGTWYRAEIANVITAQGFIPFPLQTREDINAVDTPASAVLKHTADKTYSPNDPIIGSTTAANEKIANPKGYCQAWTTDGNTAP
jgi:ABC-type phosphate transport system substrate-binding protein